MTRVSTSDVRNIGGFNGVSSDVIQENIEEAHVIVNSRVEGYVENSLLDTIEKRLAAHFVALHPDGLAVSTDAVGRQELIYQGDSDMGLEATRHGQQVLELVPEGLLTASPGGNYVRTTHSDKDPEDLTKRDDEAI